MIETIYNLENNENRKPDINIRLPKNIKQIGQSDITVSSQIYIEENVLTYIKQSAEEEGPSYGVLLGEKKVGNGYTYIFINGMIEVENIVDDAIIFSDEVWTGIYDDIRRYYKEASVMGWYAKTNMPQYLDMHSIKKLHLDHFAGNGKVFLDVNSEENDEAFYLYEHNSFKRQPCYHVYFEKLADFEDYMFGTGKSVVSSKQKDVEKYSSKESGGKYGIALNNKIDKREDGRDAKDTQINLPNLARYKRVASVATIIALAGVAGIMAKNGHFDALQNRMEEVIDGVLGNEEDNADGGDSISVGGIVALNNSTAAPVNADSNNSSTENDSEGSNNTELTSNKDEQPNSETSTEQESEDKSDGQLESSDKNEPEQTVSADVDSDGEEETTVSIAEVNANYETYVVKAGETLFSISMELYGTPEMIEEIASLNKLPDENHVMEGQKILLP